MVHALPYSFVHTLLEASVVPRGDIEGITAAVATDERGRHQLQQYGCQERVTNHGLPRGVLKTSVHIFQYR